MYWKLVPSQWWKVSSLIILALIPLSCNLGININNKQDLVQDIKLGEGEDWATGFLLPPGAQDGQDAIKDSPIFIYDFKPNFDVTKNNKTFMISLSFHEYYFRCKIFVCNKVEDVLTPYWALNTRLQSHRIDVIPFEQHCQLIDPILHGPVHRRNGPFFVEVLCDSQLGYIPERHHLLQERGDLLYNFTYEINVINTVPVNTVKVKHHVVNFTSEQKKQLCNNNGYLILQETKTSQFEFSCKCLLGTSGPTCRWGPQCPASDDRSMCNNRGFCWARPMENSHGCICDKEYIGPACNHFTAFYNLDGYHNLMECPRNNSCHSCYILPNRIEKCSCRIGYKLSPSGLCINDSLIVILRYATYNTSSLTKFDVATKIKSLFPCSKEFQLPNLVNQISIDESSNIVKIHDVSKALFSVVGNASLWSEGLASNCTYNYSYFKSLSSCETKFNSSSDVRICLSLVRIQYAETVIEMFRNSLVNSTLKKICCHTSSNHFSITFYKENKIINERPFNLSKIKNMFWQSGDLRMEPHDKGVCLIFNKASAIDDGVYICKAEDQFHTEEKELYVKQSKPKLSVDVGPEKVTVLQGGNITVNCTVKSKSYYMFHPRLSFYTDLPNSNASNYPLKTRTISLQLVNVTRNVIVTCNVSDVYNVEKYYTEKNITVEVVYPNQPYCSFNSSYGIDWQPQKISATTEMKCPKGYSGYCTRDCTICRDLIYAFWELPDCSQCERKEITEFVKNVSLYSRGIKPYLPNPNLLFKTLKNILSKTAEFLPGEMSSVIRVLNFILSSLPVDLEFDDFYSLLDFIMSKDNFILEKDFENLETLMNRFPLKFLKGDYAARYINKDTLTGYLSVPFVHEFPYKIVFPSDDISYKKRSVSFTHTRQQRTVHPKISVLIYDERRKATIISIIIFKKAHLFFKHQKKIIQWKAESKTLEDEILDDHFGKLSSPLVQARLFNEHQMVNDDTEKITAIFEPCTPQAGTDLFSSSISSATLRCGMYIPKKRIWNTTGCSFNNSGESCSCTCVRIGGWIGLVDSNTSRHTEILLSQNFVAAVGCMISALTLTLTIIVLMIRCGFWSTRLLTKVIECIALLVANVVFFSCSIVKTENTDQMTLLIIISGSLVMSLSMSICHQIDILSKYHEYRIGPLRKLDIANPSFLLTFACVLISALLGAILWTIGRVKSITPSNAWLPENDEASSLSLVVVCCFSILLLLICIMASISWLKLNRLNVLFPSTGTEILFKELKTTSFLTLVKIFYISTSIYQDKEVGKYIFLLASIVLGKCYLILYTCENLRSGDSSPSTSHSELQANERSKRKLCDLKTCLWRWLCSTSVIYSGVAGTEVSPLPNDDSIEFRKRNESLHSPNSSTKNEENDNCLKSSLDIESHISTNWGLSEGTLKNKETHCTCLSEQNLPFSNSGNVVVSIERLCLNNIRSDTSALKTSNSGISSNHIRDLKDQGNQKITERYLCMNGKRTKLEVQNSRYLPMNGPNVKDIEIPIFYENVSNNSEGSEVRAYFKYDSKNYNSEKVQSVNNSNSVSKNNDKANNDSFMILYNTNTANSSTLPFSDKRKNLFSNFSSKFFILGSKTKRIHKNLSSGRIAMSTSNCERNILINGDQRVFYKDTDSKPSAKEYYLGHRRQHSF